MLEDLVPICVNSTHLKKNHTSSSQTLYKFVPSETEDVWNFSINFTASTPPSKFNIHKFHTSKMCLVGTYFYTDVKLENAVQQAGINLANKHNGPFS